MLSIGQFFKKIQNKQSKELFVRSVISQTLIKCTTVVVPVESISISSGVVNIQHISSVARSQIYIKKQQLLADINTAQDVYTITDIK